MRSRPHIFWYSFGLTLLLLLSLALVFLLAGQRTQQSRLRQVAADGTLQIEPGAQNSYRLLLVVQKEEPEFVLLRLDGPQRKVTFCGLPPELRVNAPAGTTTLADCTLAAGPGRAAQLLCVTLAEMATGETAAPGNTPNYLSATPATWQLIAGSTATARFDSAALLPAAGRDGAKQSVLNLSPATTPDAIAALQVKLTAADARATARAAVWAAFARQDPIWLAGRPAALKQQSAKTLTDLRAQDIAAIADTLDYLAAQPGTAIDYEKAPTAEAAGAVTLTAEGRNVVAELLG